MGNEAQVTMIMELCDIGSPPFNFLPPRDYHESVDDADDSKYKKDCT